MAEKQVRVVVAGGRDFTDAAGVRRVLDALRDRVGNMLLVSGACRTGVDAIAEEWAARWAVPVERWPARWYLHGKSAGPRRNRDMLDSGVDMLVAFPGGRGTASVTQLAKQRGIETITVTAAPGSAT